MPLITFPSEFTLEELQHHEIWRKRKDFDILLPLRFMNLTVRLQAVSQRHKTGTQIQMRCKDMKIYSFNEEGRMNLQ